MSSGPEEVVMFLVLVYICFFSLHKKVLTCISESCKSHNTFKKGHIVDKESKISLVVWWTYKAKVLCIGNSPSNRKLYNLILQPDALTSSRPCRRQALTVTNTSNVYSIPWNKQQGKSSAINCTVTIFKCYTET